MARFYTDEDFPVSVTAGLRAVGHDILTTQQMQRFGAWDADQLRFAIGERRILLTCNRKDFRTLHEAWLTWSRFWQEPRPHAGIFIFDQLWGQAGAAVYVAAINDFLSGRSGPLDNMAYDWFWRHGNSAWEQWRPEGVKNDSDDKNTDESSN